MTIIKQCVAAAAAACALNAGAQTSIGLQNYTLNGSYAIATLDGLGLEASAVTYARDRGTLFVVGDEGLGVVEITRSGQTVGSMAFANWPAASTNHDAEGLAYLGNGVLVVAEERLQDAYRFNYTAGGAVALANADTVSFGETVGNIGTEGIAVDPRTGRFITVKQEAPLNVLEGTLTFASPASGGGVSKLAPLFDPALLGVSTLSDVASLGGVDAIAAAPAGNNLLLLSLGSRRLLEVNRQGQIVSSLDLSGLTTQAIEGVTVDERGTVYLVAENAGALPSQLLVLSAVPEPGTWALWLGGTALLAAAARTRRAV